MGKSATGLVSGAVAGGVARTCVAPLDLLKVRFQVMNEFEGVVRYRSVWHGLTSTVKTEGVFGLWKGNTPAMIMVVVYAAVQFASYECIKLQLEPFIKSAPLANSSATAPAATVQQNGSPAFSINPTIGHLSCGWFAGVVATSVSYPLDLLRTRLAVHRGIRPPTMSESLGHAWRHGYRGLYAGYVPTVLTIGPYAALSFAFYEACRVSPFILNFPFLENSANLRNLVAGSLAGTAAKLIMMPSDNIKKRMQVQGMQLQGVGAIGDGSAHTKYYRGAMDCLRQTSREGVRALWAGTVPALIKAAPNAGIMFATYGAVQKYLLSLQGIGP